MDCAVCFFVALLDSHVVTIVNVKPRIVFAVADTRGGENNTCPKQFVAYGALAVHVIRTHHHPPLSTVQTYPGLPFYMDLRVLH